MADVPVDELTAPDGIRLAYRDIGTGPLVMLLHGIGADAALNWDATGIGPILVEHGYRTVALDLRGHGASDRPYEPTAYHDSRFAADASALLDHLRAETCHLVGYSLGALIALSTAPAEPRVRSVVLAGIGAASLDPTIDRVGIAEVLEADDVPEGGHPEGHELRMVSELTGADRRAMAACQRGRDPVPPDPSRVTVPALVVAGVDDTSAGSVDDLAARLPLGRAVSIAGDHTTALFGPDLAAAIVDFLDDQPR